MRFAAFSPRVLVGLAIAAAHAVGIYMALAWTPQLRSIAADRPVSVHFISQAEPRRPLRAPETPIVAAQPILADAPTLPAMASWEIEASERAISAPQRNTPQATPVEDRSIPKLVSAVEYLREPSPRYPPQSRRLREQGVVVLRVVIDEGGRACDIEVESSSGHVRLDRAAREAVAGAAFRPYIEDGAPRRALVLIPIEFFLNRGSA